MRKPVVGLEYESKQFKTQIDVKAVASASAQIMPPLNYGY